MIELKPRDKHLLKRELPKRECIECENTSLNLCNLVERDEKIYLSVELPTRDESLKYNGSKIKELETYPKFCIKGEMQKKIIVVWCEECGWISQTFYQRGCLEADSATYQPTALYPGGYHIPRDKCMGITKANAGCNSSVQLNINNLTCSAHKDQEKKIKYSLITRFIELR